MMHLLVACGFCIQGIPGDPGVAGDTGPPGIPVRNNGYVAAKESAH